MRFITALLTGLLILAGCAVNPVTGRQELMLLSEQDERRMGAQTDQSVIEQYGIYEDAPLQDYIQALGLPMARASHRPDLPWQFRVMDSPVVNAFAAPGGYIYVTRGLLAAANSEAELVGVLGHEIGHVTARHSAQQYSKIMLTSLGLGVGVSLTGDFGRAMEPLLQTGSGLLFLKFSRDDERESDRLGVEYASRAGYDAGRMANFFETLNTQPVDGDGGERLPEFLSSHPHPANREATVRRLASEWQARLPGQAFRVNRDAFLDRIDGLVYGDDPRQGYRDGDWFYLPQYQVQYRIPAQWQFARAGAQARMVHPDQRALILFAIEKQGRLDDVVAAAIKALQAKVLQTRAVSAPGMTGRQVVALIEKDGQRALLLSTFFQKGPAVFVFHGLTAEKDFAGMQALLGQSAGSFGPITDQAKLNRQPQRLRIQTVNTAASLREVLRGYQVDPDLWEKVAWMNAMRLGDQVARGQRIKIVK